MGTGGVVGLWECLPWFCSRALAEVQQKIRYRTTKRLLLAYDCQTRSFTYVDDCVHATVAAGTQPGTDGEIFNIGSDVETSMLELARLVVDLTQSRPEIRFVPSEAVYGPAYEDILRRGA